MFISISHNLRTREVLKRTLTVFNERQKKIKTADVNEFIKKAMSYHSPPVINGKNITIKYGAQVYHSPPIFAFFTNHPSAIPIQYKRYMENSLRDHFGTKVIINKNNKGEGKIQIEFYSEDDLHRIIEII